MRDIRRLEKETQLILKKKLGRVAEDQELEEEEEEEGEEEEEEEEELVKRGEENGEDVKEMEKEKKGEVESNKAVTDLEDPQTSAHHLPSIPPVSMQRSASDVPSGQEVTTRTTLHLPMVRKGSLPIVKKTRRDRTGTQGSGRSTQHRRSDGLLPVSRSHSKVEGDSDGESMYSARPEWALDSIAISESDSELEFFDAIGEEDPCHFHLLLASVFRDGKWNGYVGG